MNMIKTVGDLKKALLAYEDIRKIREGVHRVLFSRVDSARLYNDIAGRLKALEMSVATLTAAT